MSIANYITIINLLEAKPAELEKISADNLLALNLQEMQAIQKYYQSLSRNPTDVELETIAQTWSEHCKHKTLTGIIEYREKGEGKREKKRIYNNLLKETVFKVTKELDKKWCISVFKDNAGIIEFDKDYGIAFKVETHNHPSAIEPYGGAGTGIGGVIRDILGVGLGAKPVANTDVFCFGPLDFKYEKLPEGVLHPKRIFKGVVKGVSDYGNRMGIPTANGAVLFDEGYLCNPVVYCGTVGIIPKDKCFKKVHPGDLIVAVGGKTGRDGIHGATFSSIALNKDTQSSCVQIGNPIVEKKVLDTVLQARDKNLYNAITDCGAGGFSSAVGELGANCGAKVHLDRVPLKYAGLAPWEIWVSEAQERMVLSVPKRNIKKLLKVFTDEDVEATVIGEFTNTGKLEIFYKKEQVCELDMYFLHHGVTRKKLKAVWKGGKQEKMSLRGVNKVNDEAISLTKVPYDTSSSELGDLLKRILSSPNVCSKDWVIRQYDYEVQGQTVIKPFVGKNNTGPSDATVIYPYASMSLRGVAPLAPRRSNLKGIAISNGIKPKYSNIDIYWMAASAIDEALRNIICVGGNLNRTALLDNFTWGNPDNPWQLASLVRACQACYDMASVYGTPFISGKDSLNNEFIAKGGRRSISVLPTLLISAISVIEDIKKVITMDLKQSGNSIYILGITKDELGGSELSALVNKVTIHSTRGSRVSGSCSAPTVNPQKAKLLMNSLSRAIKKGLVKSCHDCSEGGLAVSCAEMCFSGELGMEIDLSKVPVEFSSSVVNPTLTILFSESNSRFVVEVEPRDENQFEKILAGNVYSKIGKVTEEKKFVLYGLDGEIQIEKDIFELKNSWQRTLKNV